jgi:hypothetical protein
MLERSQHAIWNKRREAQFRLVVGVLVAMALLTIELLADSMMMVRVAVAVVPNWSVTTKSIVLAWLA